LLAELHIAEEEEGHERRRPITAFIAERVKALEGTESPGGPRP
jgi:hypothetical protein